MRAVLLFKKQSATMMSDKNSEVRYFGPWACAVDHVPTLNLQA